MCFTKNGLTKKSEPKIAKEDIKVYKAIGKDGSSWLWNLRINGRNASWTPGYIYTESPALQIYNRNGQPTIEEGAFHSHKEKNLNGLYMGHRDMIVKMIIPKGSKYFYNESTGEYVSDTIYYPKQ